MAFHLDFRVYGHDYELDFCGLPCMSYWLGKRWEYPSTGVQCGGDVRLLANLQGGAELLRLLKEAKTEVWESETKKGEKG